VGLQLIDMTDVLVDEPSAPKRGVPAGAAAQVCSYEEVLETAGSDCSCDDFDGMFDAQLPVKPKSSRLRMPVGRGARGTPTRGERGREAREQKRSLLTDVDVLVS
jgi:hypothetical protein